MRRLAGRLRSLVWLPLALTACGGRTTPASSPRSAPAPARSRGASAGRITDANSAALLLTTNNVSLAAARIALTRASRRDVKALARSETASHTALNTTLTRLLTRLEINPREEEIDRILRDQSMARRDTLRNISARRVDSTYVANEVLHHTEVLEAIDRVFLPSARHAELRDYIVSLRPTIVAHLEAAEQLQAALTARR